MYTTTAGSSVKAGTIPHSLNVLMKSLDLSVGETACSLDSELLLFFTLDIILLDLEQNILNVAVLLRPHNRYYDKYHRMGSSDCEGIGATFCTGAGFYSSKR